MVRVTYFFLKDNGKHALNLKHTFPCSEQMWLCNVVSVCLISTQDFKQPWNTKVDTLICHQFLIQDNGET